MDEPPGKRPPSGIQVTPETFRQEPSVVRRTPQAQEVIPARTGCDQAMPPSCVRRTFDEEARRISSSPHVRAERSAKRLSTT